MKRLGYIVIRLWVRACLFCYYRQIRVVGKEHIPFKKPMLLLSNHQNALMDVLLIATQCGKKPWFLARSDVFGSDILNSFFTFLQMLPVYRLRDGRDKLTRNKPIFETCAQLLRDGQCIVLFPEANHSLRRTVRPLSKGFVRIASTAMENDGNIDLMIVPVGQNYAYPMQPGDSATLCFGEAIFVKEYAASNNFIGEIKNKVYESLKQLTTHIPEDSYDGIIDEIGKNGSVFLFPNQLNDSVASGTYTKMETKKEFVLPRILKTIFVLWNLPMVLLWRSLIKPRVPEEEFMATFRFGFVLIGYPLCYLIVLLILWNLFNIKTACLVILGHAVFSVLLVKMGITSSCQRK